MIEITTNLPHEPRRFAIVRRRGTLYDLGGEQVELFSLKVLAEALDRSRDTLRDWESRGHLPRPLFRVARPLRTEHDRPWRAYSGAQVVNANRLATQHFGGRRRLDDATVFARFVAALRHAWYSPEIIAITSVASRLMAPGSQS